MNPKGNSKSVKKIAASLNLAEDATIEQIIKEIENLRGFARVALEEYLATNDIFEDMPTGRLQGKNYASQT